jgi:hypothetical protein
MDENSNMFTKNPVILPSEDRNRMSRLYEEVRIRLEEMAMITARTLKINAGRGSEVKFCPIPSADEIEFEAVELVRAPRGRAGYDYRQGVCFEFDGTGTEACPDTGA